MLDFFAGSCSLAQAVLELNREDGGNRRFICTQIDEPLASPRTLKDGTVLKTISDIGAERIRRSIRKLQQADEGKFDLSEGAPHEDLGVRFFKMTPSHFRAWEPPADNSDATAYLAQLELFTDRLIDGWKPESVIYEMLLNEGFSLTSSIEPVSTTIEGMSVSRVTDEDGERSMYVCLDDHVSGDIAKALELSRDDLLVCRDRALDDTTAANLALQCRLKAI